MKIVFILSFLCLCSNTFSDPFKVAVFCSADDKVCENFKILAHKLGRKLALQEFGLITGGSKTGLMKEVSDGYSEWALDLKYFWGIMPQVLKSYNVQHPKILKENLIWTEDLHSRLSMFHKLADAVVILPGGFGTLHELMDFLVDSQFNANKKPIILFNVDHFWDALLLQFKVMVTNKLLAEQHLASITLVDCEDECIQQLLKKNNTIDHGLDTHYWKQETK